MLERLRAALTGVLAQSGLLAPHSLDSYIVPSNAPSLASVPTLASRRYNRRFKFTLVLGLMRRLAARLAHFQGAQLYRSAVLFKSEAELVGIVLLEESCWTVETLTVQLFLQIVDCVESLLAESTIRTERSALAMDGSIVLLALPSELTPDWQFISEPHAPPLSATSVLGQGGGGTVYVANWSGHQVAVKQLQDATLPAAVREVRLALSVQHPNLVRSLAVVPSPLGLVMELFPLKDLCHGLHYPNAELDQRRHALQTTQTALDRERALIMANY